MCVICDKVCEMDTIRFIAQQRSIIDDSYAYAYDKIYHLSERNILHELDFNPPHFDAIKNEHLVEIISNLIFEIKHVKSTVNDIVKALKIKHETVYSFIMATPKVDSLMCNDLLCHIDLKFKQKINSTDIQFKTNILLALYKQKIDVVRSKKDFNGIAISWIAKNWSTIMIENIAICSYLKNYIDDNLCSDLCIQKIAILSLAVHRSMIVSIYCYIIEQYQFSSKSNNKCNYNENSIDKLIDFVVQYSMHCLTY